MFTYHRVIAFGHKSVVFPEFWPKIVLVAKQSEKNNAKK